MKREINRNNAKQMNGKGMNEYLAVFKEPLCTNNAMMIMD